MKIYNDIILAILGICISWLLIFLLYDLPKGLMIFAISNQYPKSQHLGYYRVVFLFRSWDYRRFGSLFCRIFPLGVVGILVSLQIYIPQYFVVERLGVDFLGFFASIMYLFIFIVRIVNSIGHSVSSRLARYLINNDKDKFLKLILKILLIGITVGFVGILLNNYAGKTILRLLYTREYSQHSYLLNLILLAGIIRFCASVFPCLPDSRCHSITSYI